MRDFYENIWFVMAQKQKTPSLESALSFTPRGSKPLPTSWVASFIRWCLVTFSVWNLQAASHPRYLCKTKTTFLGMWFTVLSGLRGSNPPPQPWQGCALPNELNPHMPPVGIEPTTREFSIPCSTNWATEADTIPHGDCLVLDTKIKPTWTGLEPVTFSVTG